MCARAFSSLTRRVASLGNSARRALHCELWIAMLEDYQGWSCKIVFMREIAEMMRFFPLEVTLLFDVLFTVG